MMRSQPLFRLFLPAIAMALFLSGLIGATALAAPPDPDAGLVVVGVEAGGPAAQAGIVRGDVLLSVDGRAVNTFADWQTATAAVRPGQEVEITFRHGDEVKTVTVTPVERNGRLHWGLQLYFGGVFGPFMDGPFGFMFRTPPGLRDGSVLIVEVVPDSPAAQAGLRVGDRIVAVDGERLSLTADLAERIAGYRPGDTVTLTVLRDGREQEVEVTLGRHPERPAAAYLGIRYSAQPSLLPFEELPLPSQPEATSQGARIDRVKVRTPADRASLKPGEVIIAVDDRPVADAADLATILRAYRPGEVITLTVRAAETDVRRRVQVTLAEHPDDPERAYLGVEVSDATVPPADSATKEKSSRRFFDLPLPFGRDWNLRLPQLPFDLENLRLPQLPFDLDNLRRLWPWSPGEDTPSQGLGL
ncbi:MAG: PDZ domain-containing protein [Anaerolineae bacterium]|nr:PDZ domain-containing protein [Caldilineales bacterium]MDW8268158.1 PDZ domain-containing protein [Anaerolineae bacterium]